MHKNYVMPLQLLHFHTVGAGVWVEFNAPHDTI